VSRRLADRLQQWRRRLVLVGLLFGAAAVLLRAGQVQIVQAAEWRDLAEAQHRSDVAIEATRGSILDRDGTPLAVSRERIRVSVAPREIRDLDAVRELLREELGLTRSQVVQLTSRERVWGVAPHTYAPDVRERLRSVPGVHLERVLQRFHPHGDLARSVLGVVQEGSGRGGIEQAFDSLLGGTSGREVVARDNVGREIPGERVTMIAPRAGGEVVLTLDMDLQEIAQQALEEAIGETDAHGGDVVVTDPRTGEVLALVSIRGGRTTALSAVNTPYEPGSTLKPFTVAGLLQRHLVSMEDTVDVGDGSWNVEGRTLHDTHTRGRSRSARRCASLPTSASPSRRSRSRQARSTRTCATSASAARPASGCPARCRERSVAPTGGVHSRPSRWRSVTRSR
jgi:cell division protein FtsI (penicillin-binding protein 3)